MKPYCASKQAADLVDLGGLLFRGLTAQAVDGLNQLHHVAIGLEGSYAHKHSEHCQRFPWRPDRGASGQLLRQLHPAICLLKTRRPWTSSNSSGNSAWYGRSLSLRWRILCGWSWDRSMNLGEDGVSNGYVCVKCWSGLALSVGRGISEEPPCGPKTSTLGYPEPVNLHLLNASKRLII